jgi:hypothetical protein
MSRDNGRSIVKIELIIIETIIKIFFTFCTYVQQNSSCPTHFMFISDYLHEYAMGILSLHYDCHQEMLEPRGISYHLWNSK